MYDKPVEHLFKYSSRSDMFRIIPISDIHIGNATCREKLLRSLVDDIASDDFAYIILMGDLCEFINRRDPRFEMEGVASWLWGVGDLAKAQRQRIVEILEPVSHKILAMVEGNHEHSIYQHLERDVYSTIAEALRPEPSTHWLVGPDGFLRLRFQRLNGSMWTIVLYLTHGWWGGRLMGSGALNLERILGWVDADIVLAGHDHRLRVFPLAKEACTKYRRYTKQCYAVSCGGFITRPLYARRKGHRPLPVGWAEIRIWPDKRRIKITV